MGALYFTLMYPMYILCTYYSNNWVLTNPEATPKPNFNPSWEVQLS